MFKKSGSVIKRLASGYGFFFLLILAGVTVELPFVIVVTVGMGLIAIDGFPFPYDVFRLASIISVGITLVVGLRWIYFPSRRLDDLLIKLHSYFITSRKYLLFRFTGVLLAIPLFAFILIPNAVIWIGIGSVLNLLYRGEELSVELYAMIALLTGFLWLAVVIGKLCPKKRILRTVILRCRQIFTDWVLEPANPRAAAEKRDNIYKNCEE